MLGELPRRHEEPRLERAHRLVERANGGVEIPADLREVAGEDAEPLVELAAELRDLACAFGDRLLLPPVGDGAEQSDQSCGRRDHDARLGAHLEQRAVLVERCAVQPLVDEHDDELGRVVELAPVALLSELGDVVAQLPRVAGEMRPLQLGVVAVDRVEVCLDRHLRVDDDRLAAGELDDEIGPEERALVIACRFLCPEVAVVEHAGELDDAPELHLPHCPRTFGARKAVTRLPVSLRRRSWPSATSRRRSPIALTSRVRFSSSARACDSNFSSVALIGASFSSVSWSSELWLRRRTSPVVALRRSSQRPSVSSMRRRWPRSAARTVRAQR